MGRFWYPSGRFLQSGTFKKEIEKVCGCMNTCKLSTRCFDRYGNVSEYDIMQRYLVNSTDHDHDMATNIGIDMGHRIYMTDIVEFP